jgi:transketolase
MAAGLAMAGLYPIVYSITPFVTMRCYEQVRNDISYQQLPVCIVGNGAGVSYGALGATHHALEDYALMSGLPGMNVVAPGNSDELSDLLPQIWASPNAAYIRLDNDKAVKVQHTDKSVAQLGKVSRYVPGGELLLVAVGGVSDIVIQAHRILECQGYSVGWAQVHTIKPFDESFWKEVAKQYRAVFIVEDHFVTHGAGEEVARFMMEQAERPEIFEVIGYKNRFASCAGKQSYLRRWYGIDPELVARRIEERCGVSAQNFKSKQAEVKGMIG